MPFDERKDMMMTEGLGIEAGREARPTNSTTILPTQHLDVKPAIYACPPQHPHHSNPSMHPHAHHPPNLALSMSKNGDMEKIENFFFASMLPNYAPVDVSVGNNEEAYSTFLTTSPSTSIPLGNSADFLV